MYKHIHYLAFLLLHGSVMAQTARLEKTPHKFYGGIYPHEFSVMEGFSDSGFIVSDNHDGARFFSEYKLSDCSKGEQFSLKNPLVGKKHINYYRNFLNGNEVTAIYGAYLRKAKQYQLYGRVMNRQGEMIDSACILMDCPARSEWDYSRIFFSYNEDRSILLVYRELTYEESDKRMLLLRWYDRHLHLLHEQRAVLGGDSLTLQLHRVLVNSDGGFVAVSSSADPDQLGGTAIRIFSCRPDDAAPKEHIIHVPAFTMRYCDVSQAVLNQNQLHISGFYSGFPEKENKQDMQGINGVFRLEFDAASMQVVKSEFSLLGTDDMRWIMVAGTKTREDMRRAENLAGRYDRVFNLQHLASVVRSDGSMVMVGEIRYYRTYYSGLMSRRIIYFTEAIAEFHFDSGGKFTGIRTVNKRQVSANERLIGTLVLCKGDSIVYVYADNARNMDVRKLKEHPDDAFRFVRNDIEKPRLCYVWYQNGKFMKEALFRPSADSAVAEEDPVYSHEAVGRPHEREPLLYLHDNAFYFDGSSVFVWGDYLYRISLD